MPVTDARAIRNSPSISVNGETARFAAASTGLVAAYSSSLLGSWRRASRLVAMLAGLYSFLYLTLNAESYAMLAGSIGLWMILGLVMYLTRGIDWYQWGLPDKGAGVQEELFTGKLT